MIADNQHLIQIVSPPLYPVPDGVCEIHETSVNIRLILSYVWK